MGPPPHTALTVPLYLLYPSVSAQEKDLAWLTDDQGMGRLIKG